MAGVGDDLRLLSVMCVPLKVTVRSEPVRHCPFCGNGGVYVPTVYSNPPMPNRWR